MLNHELKRIGNRVELVDLGKLHVIFYQLIKQALTVIHLNLSNSSISVIIC